jgi:hypothetical protein
MEIYQCERERWKKEDRIGMLGASGIGMLLISLGLWIFGIIIPWYFYIFLFLILFWLMHSMNS